MKKQMKAWALSRKFDHGEQFLGKYCWTDAKDADFSTKLFRTREHARFYKKSCCFKNAKIKRVFVTIETI